MSTYTDIRKALEENLLTATGVSSTAVAWENAMFNPDGKTTWVRSSLQVSSQVAASLGPNAARRDDGVLLLDVFGEQNKGPGTLDTLADNITQVFEPGTLLTAGGKTIRILSCQRSLGRNEQPWYFIPLAVYFYTYINE
jgi:hypothetical protein